MIDELDIDRFAQFLVESHGETAREIARAGVDKLATRGDMDGEVLWLRIAEAVCELLDETPRRPRH